MSIVTHALQLPGQKRLKVGAHALVHRAWRDISTQRRAQLCQVFVLIPQHAGRGLDGLLKWVEHEADSLTLDRTKLIDRRGQRRCIDTHLQLAQRATRWSLLTEIEDGFSDLWLRARRTHVALAGQLMRCHLYVLAVFVVKGAIDQLQNMGLARANSADHNDFDNLGHGIYSTVQAGHLHRANAEAPAWSWSSCMIMGNGG